MAPFKAPTDSGSGPNRSTCPNGPWLERFEPFPVATPAWHKLLASEVENRRKQDGFSQVPIVNDSKALRGVPRWHSMLSARHGQALMFCGFAAHQKRRPMQEAQANHWQEVTLQTISHASEALMFRSEALRTRYINA